MEEIIKLPVVRGSNYARIQDFHHHLARNFDALKTLGEDAMLSGLVVSTLNKVPMVKPDLVHLDESLKEWDMKGLLDALQSWLKGNKSEEMRGGNEHEQTKKRERNWYTQGGTPKNTGPVCLFCEGTHWGDQCTSYNSIAKRRQLFVRKRLCFNCGRPGHRENKCRSRGCFKCRGKHHTSLCDKASHDGEKPKQGGDQSNHNAMLNGYSLSSEEKSLPAIVPLKIKGKTFWAYLDTGSGKNFISNEAVQQLKLNPKHHESRHILTVNGSKKSSLPVFDVTISSVDGEASEQTGPPLQPLL